MHIVLVGAGGTGISGLAFCFRELGFSDIVCIDANESEVTENLKKAGCTVILGHGNYTVQASDIVIYSDIENIKNGPEVQQSWARHAQQPSKKNYHIPYSYNEFLAEISKRFTTIAITGSNGKSSTTAMTIHTLARVSPDFFGLGIVGALVPAWDNRNCQINTTKKNDLTAIFTRMLRGKGTIDRSLVKKYAFVIEACEYKEHFLLLDTDRACITNIVRDHADYFKTETAYIAAFEKCIEKTRYGVITNAETIAALDKDFLSQEQTKIILAPEKAFPFTTLFGNHAHKNGSLVAELVKKSTPNPSFVKGGEKKDEKTYFSIHHDAKTLQERGLVRKGGHIPYNPNLKERARELRKNMTGAEQKLRKEYLQKQNFIVLRQKPIDNFIADFYIPIFGLIIEVDGEVHKEQKEYDEIRTNILEQYEIKVIRFTNDDILDSFDNVIKELDKFLRLTSPSSSTKRETPSFDKGGPGRILHTKETFDASVSAAISTAPSLRRRMELLGTTKGGALLYSDYGHHAPALVAGLDALKEKYPDKKIAIIFQPHQAQRVIQGRDAFAKALARGDEILIYKLYTAREDIKDFSFASFDELGTAFAEHCDGRYIVDREEIYQHIDTKNDDTVFVIFSAGDLDWHVRKIIK